MACSAYKWVELVPPNIKFLLSANKSGHSLLPLEGNGQISLQFRTMPNCLVVVFFLKYWQYCVTRWTIIKFLQLYPVCEVKRYVYKPATEIIKSCPYCYKENENHRAESKAQCYCRIFIKTSHPLVFSFLHCNKKSVMSTLCQ